MTNGKTIEKSQPIIPESEQQYRTLQEKFLYSKEYMTMPEVKRYEKLNEFFDTYTLPYLRSKGKVDDIEAGILRKKFVDNYHHRDPIKKNESGRSVSEPTVSRSEIQPKEKEEIDFSVKDEDAKGKNWVAQTIYNNKDVPFVERILKPYKAGSVKLPKEKHPSTHLMRAEQDESGDWLVFPMLTRKNGKWVFFDDWEDAMSNAKERNNFISFGEDSDKALKFAEGAWKDADIDYDFEVKKPDISQKEDITRQRVSEEEPFKRKEIAEKQTKEWFDLPVEERERLMAEGYGENIGKLQTDMNSFNRQFVKLFSDIPKASAITSTQIQSWMGKDVDVQTTAAWELGIGIENAMNDIFPINQDYAKGYRNQLFSGAGSMIPYFFGGWATSGLKASVAGFKVAPGATVAFMGSAQNSVPEYEQTLNMAKSVNEMTLDEFIDANLSPGMGRDRLTKIYNKLKGQDPQKVAFESFLKNGLAGSLEAVPIAMGLSALAKMSGGKIIPGLLRMTESGMEEAIQESTTQYYANLTAKQLYDEQRKWHEGMWEAGTTGFILGAMMMGISGAANAKMSDEGLSAEERAYLLKAREEIDQAMEQLPDDPNQVVHRPVTNDKIEELEETKQNIIKELGNNEDLDPTSRTALKEEADRINDEIRAEKDILIKTEDPDANERAAQLLEGELEKLRKTEEGVPDDIKSVIRKEIAEIEGAIENLRRPVKIEAKEDIVSATEESAKGRPFVKGGIGLSAEGDYILSDEYIGDRRIKTIEQADELIEETDRALEQIEGEMKRREEVGEQEETEYRIGTKYFETEQEFLDALENAPREIGYDLFGNLDFPMRLMDQVKERIDNLKPSRGAAENLEMISSEELGNRPESLKRRKERLQIIKDKLQGKEVEAEIREVGPEEGIPESPTDLTELEKRDWISEYSEDPDEIAQAHQRELEQPSSYTRKSIEDTWMEGMIGRKVREESYKEFGDPNNISIGLARTWFAAKGDRLNRETGHLDTIAQELSEIYGTEVTPQMIADFITENPNGVRKTTDLQRRLEKRYQEVTGLPQKKIYEHETKVASIDNLKGIEQLLKEKGIKSWFTYEDLLEEVENNRDQFTEEEYNRITKIVEDEINRPTLGIFEGTEDETVGEQKEPRKEDSQRQEPEAPGELGGEAETIGDLLAGLAENQREKAESFIEETDKAIKSKEQEVLDKKKAIQEKKNEISGRVAEQGEMFKEPKAEQGKLVDVGKDVGKENIDKIIKPMQEELDKAVDELAEMKQARNEKIIEQIKNIKSQGELFESEEGRTGDVLRTAAEKIRAGKINKTKGFRMSTGFDAIWDASLEVVASTLEGGASLVDAIAAGLNYIKNTEWYQKIKQKKKFDDAYVRHMRAALDPESNAQESIEFIEGENMEAKTADEITPVVELSEGTRLIVQMKEKLVKTFKKYFTAQGNLPLKVFQRSQKITFNLRKRLHQVTLTSIKFRKALRAEYGVNKIGEIKVTEEQLAKIDGALKEEVPLSEIPEGLRSIVTVMRNHIDSLSRELRDSGLIDGELLITIQSNLGVYLTRSYKAHLKGYKWNYKNIPQEIKNKAAGYLKKEFPNKTNEQIEGMIKNLVEEKINVWDTLKKGKLGSKDLGVLKKRKNLPEPIRALLGEVKDPMFNYANTVYKISDLIEKHRFLTEVRSMGFGDFFFKGKTPPDKTHIVQISSENYPALSPLDGLWTTPEIKEAFEAYGMPNFDANWFRLYMKVNSFVKLNKTIFSYMTHVRNFVSNIMFQVANGRYSLQNIGKSGVVWAKNRAKNQEIIEELLEEGIIGESARAGEVHDMMRDAMGGEGTMPKLLQSRLNKAAGKTIKFAEDLYLAEDDFHKVYAYLAEKQRYTEAYKKAYPEKAAEEIEQMARKRAGEITRSTMPTYSLVPEMIKQIRRFPVVGTFVSFPAEVIRNTINTAELARKELKDPVTRTIGATRLAGMLTAATLIPAITMFTRYLSGLDDEDDKDLRRFLAPWTRNSNLLHISNDGKGEYIFIDLGYSDPHNYFRKAINGVLSGDVGEGIWEIFEPFLGEELLIQRLLDISRNIKKDSNAPIYNPQDSKGKQLEMQAKYLLEGIEPGTLSNFRRIWYGIHGYQNHYGRQYDPVLEITALFTGQRIQKLNIKTAFEFKLSRFKYNYDEAKRIYTSEYYSKSTKSTERKKLKALRRANDAAGKLVEELNEDYQAALRLGVDSNEIDKLIDELGVSNETKKSIKTGVYVPMQPRGQEKTGWRK